MAHNQSIDTSSLTALINEFSRLQAKDSVTPEGLGYLLQRITDLLATAGSANALNIICNWYNRLQQAEPFITNISQEVFSPEHIILGASRSDIIEPDSDTQLAQISIRPATDESAGAMSAAHVSKLNAVVNKAASNETSIDNITGIYNEQIPAIMHDLNILKLGFGSISIDDIDNISAADSSVGRFVQVIDSRANSQGWLMHIICPNFVTQILFTHYKVVDGALITNTHDESGFHIFKRSKSSFDDASSWSPWSLVGGDDFLDLKQRLDAVIDGDKSVTALAAKGQIYTEIVNDSLRVFGSSYLIQQGYVPYLFRFTRKRNRDKIHLINNRPSVNYTKKGWHLFGSRHSVRILNNTAHFSSNTPSKFHEEAEGYSTNVEAIVHPHIDKHGHLTVPWGKSIIKLWDKKAMRNRMIRLRFAIGFAKPHHHGKGLFNTLNLVTNLAEFSVVYNPEKDSFYFSR